jgi:hypothetical protein
MLWVVCKGVWVPAFVRGRILCLDIGVVGGRWEEHFFTHLLLGYPWNLLKMHAIMLTLSGPDKRMCVLPKAASSEDDTRRWM